MHFRNRENHVVKVPKLAVVRGGELVGEHVHIAGSDVVEIHDGYAKPRVAMNGDRHPSVIEQLAPQLVPADEAEHEEWKRAPSAAGEARPAARMPTVSGLVASGVPEGVAEQLVAAAHASAKVARGEKLDEEPAPKSKKGAKAE